jgi:hypothetical protein
VAEGQHLQGFAAQSRWIIEIGATSANADLARRLKRHWNKLRARLERFSTAANTT